MLNILRLFSALRIRSPFWLTPIETMRRNYLKTPILNDRFCRLMADQISRALRVMSYQC